MYATRRSTTKGFVALTRSLQFGCEAAETRPLELWRPFPSLKLFVEVDGRWCIKNNSGIPYFTDSHKKESGNQISIRDVVRSNKVCFCTARPGRCAEEDLLPSLALLSRLCFSHVYVRIHSNGWNYFFSFEAFVLFSTATTTAYDAS